MLIALILVLISLFEFNDSKAADFKKAISLNKRPTIDHIPTRLPGQSLKSHVQEHIGCAVCIDFWNQVLNNLISIIENVGLGAGCAEICGPLRMFFFLDSSIFDI
jgi:hypothetical protein